MKSSAGYSESIWWFLLDSVGLSVAAVLSCTIDSLCSSIYSFDLVSKMLRSILSMLMIRLWIWKLAPLNSTNFVIAFFRWYLAWLNDLSVMGTQRSTFPWVCRSSLRIEFLSKVTIPWFSYTFWLRTSMISADVTSLFLPLISPSPLSSIGNSSTLRMYCNSSVTLLSFQYSSQSSYLSMIS